MIDIPSGRVAYAVLWFGGFLGMGDTLFVRCRGMPESDDEKCFVFKCRPQTIGPYPGFDQNNWPDMSDVSWGNELSAYYKVTPYWESGERTFKGGGGL